ncbi:MAG: hypothetical protein RQ899_01490 [Pseudomonadales bacterium]|nr:hypothetical protein [Pseudomonadales bacterium]
MKFIILVFIASAAGSLYAQEEKHSAPDQPAHEQQVSDTVSVLDPKEYSLFDLMKLASRADQETLTVAEMYEESTVIVRGYIDSITDGRSIQYKKIAKVALPWETALIKIEVSKVIKGEVGDYVYFEYVRGGIPAELMDRAKYTGEIMIFLRDPGWGKETYDFTDSDKGKMKEVDHLYTLTQDSAFFIEALDDLLLTLKQPLADVENEDVDPVFTGSSFDGLENAFQNSDREIPAELLDAIEKSRGR